jgi:hypothetical protein
MEGCCVRFRALNWRTGFLIGRRVVARCTRKIENNGRLSETHDKVISRGDGEEVGCDDGSCRR